MIRFIALAVGVALVPGSQALRAEDPASKSVHGKVVTVQPAEGQVSLQAADGTRIALQVDKNSKLRFDGQPVELGRFAEGTTARATYLVQGGVNRVIELVHGAPSAAAVKQQVNEALRSVKDYTFQHKDEYERRLRGVLGQLDDQIRGLEDRAAQASGDARQQLLQSANDLRARERVLRDRLQQVSTAGANAWENIRSGVHSALEDLRDAFDRATRP